ncbi:MAG: hypothetical protein ABJB32_05690 [Verrucomicrobiota bacterium]
MAILGAVAVAQILAALVIYAARSHSGPRNAQPSITAVPSAISSTVSGSPQPPASSASRLAIVPSSAADQLLRQAKQLREKGDTANSLSRLQQATALDPSNADVLAEMAMIYESMQLFDRSNETWRRLASLGPTVGPLYELADLKLKVGVPGTTAATDNVSSPATPASTETQGIPDGSTFGIAEVTPNQENDPNADTRLTLRVGVKARPKTPIDHTEVKIQVFFYDIVDNDQVVLTDADVNYRWLTPGHDWASTDTEVLEVGYFRAKQTSAGIETAIASTPAPIPPPEKNGHKGKETEPANPSPSAGELLPANESGERKYLGYIVRVYYKDQLQAVRAEPTRLLNLFPPPFTAPPQ